MNVPPEIMKVQRDIARRRRKRLILLATRLSFFVLLPTLLVAFYFYRVATPMYATHTEFIIQKAESGASSGGGGLGGLLGGSGFATVQESITVQAFLESREAMLRLEDELGFREHFSQEAIDPLNRIGPDATDEDVYDTYLRHLRIGYDPTEGLIRMEVIAADPEVSQSYSQALIGFAEERVDRMSQRLRADQMSGARENFEDAEARALEAQQRVLNLQEQRGVLSTEAEVSTVFGQIQNFELQLQEERLRLAELLSVPQPNASRVEVAERNIARLEALITDLRSSLTNTGTGEISLARNPVGTHHRPGGPRDTADDPGPGAATDGKRPDRGQPPDALPLGRRLPHRARRPRLSARLREHASGLPRLFGHLPPESPMTVSILREQVSFREAGRGPDWTMNTR